MSARRGAVLIVVAGLAALVAALAIAFLARMREDADEADELVRLTRARAMLTAALQYVAETARIGWDTPRTPEPDEAFGWVDVRDGTPGPKNQLGERLFVGDAEGRGDAFPAIGATARCPAAVLSRPPLAIRPGGGANPIPPRPELPWAELISFQRHDPQPAAAAWADYLAGDTRPVQTSTGLAWFRVHRAAAARFVLTCGAGGTLGFRDWDEVVRAGESDAFGDAAAFAELRRRETVLWFETEWSAAVGGQDVRHFLGGNGGTIALDPLSSPQTSGSDRTNPRQFAGTFRYIQRLFREPAEW